MNKADDLQISLAQEREGSDRWHWTLLKYGGEWHNVGSNLEDSYEKAVKAAKEAYDAFEN